MHLCIRWNDFAEAVTPLVFLNVGNVVLVSNNLLFRIPIMLSPVSPSLMRTGNNNYMMLGLVGQQDVFQTSYMAITENSSFSSQVCIGALKNPMQSHHWTPLSYRDTIGPPSKTYGKQVLTYYSALTVHLPSEATVATCPIGEKNWPPFSSYHFEIVLFSVEAPYLERSKH